MPELDTTTPTEIKLTPKQKARIQMAVKALNEVRAELEPQTNLEGGINWYLEDCGNLCLMEGNTHASDYKSSPRHNGVIAVFNLDNASGGGW
ncbi:TPA: hypothetical protein I7682_17785 [Vibrio vulnificus]|nr:hypothetical protein [Vibrio vulnificus]